MSFWPKVFMDVRQDLSYGADWPRQSMDILVIWIFDVIFAKFFMDVRQNLNYQADLSQYVNGPFSRSNKPKAGKPPTPTRFANFCVL
ncbi:hypothetical protein H5410_056521 [Solanum commersonii]|uniref:Uncharacterized protein n=1 Tax=Solanum commersonii TaxID=4109 RepID=A0A9J5WKH4_SOLCO|nr:hypothetical protein H5410_056521 [Solanum commersonii]